MFAGMPLKLGLEKWESCFPLDSWWRKKYKIPFGSKNHLEISQIDIYFDWLSDQIHKEFISEIDFLNDKKEKLKTSISTDRSDKPKFSDEDFENIDISKII